MGGKKFTLQSQIAEFHSKIACLGLLSCALFWGFLVIHLTLTEPQLAAPPAQPLWQDVFFFLFSIPLHRQVKAPPPPLKKEKNTLWFKSKKYLLVVTIGGENKIKPYQNRNAFMWIVTQHNQSWTLLGCIEECVGVLYHPICCNEAGFSICLPCWINGNWTFNQFPLLKKIISCFPHIISKLTATCNSTQPAPFWLVMGTNFQM